MKCATLMVQTELGQSNAALLELTLRLAMRLRAVVAGVAVAQPFQVHIGEGEHMGEIICEDPKTIDQEAQEAESEFRELLSGGSAALDWQISVTPLPLADRLAQLASAADYLIIGVDQENYDILSPVRNVLPDDLVVQTGRPVLVVPKHHRPFDFKCALVAWEETREARRSLADALPILLEMDKVVLLEVAEADDHERAHTGLQRVADWLRRHGVHAEIQVSVPAGRCAQRILAVADEVGADLIIAGAYGHSRMRERLLGGVSFELLRSSDRCLLISH